MTESALSPGASATALQGRRLSDVKIRELIGKAQEWAMLHGVLLKPADNVESTSVVEHAPMTLFPSPMPAHILQEARELQIHFNRLMHRVAYDHEFLESKLKNVIKVDNFTRILWDIYQTVRKEGLCQPISLGIFRNDFMLDVQHHVQENNGAMPLPTLKQIEFNTMASGLGGLSSAIWKVHRYTMTLAGVPFRDEQIPESSPAKTMAAGLVKAWETYGTTSAIIVFVVQEIERNRMDQKWLEMRIFEINKNITVKYVSLQYAADNGQLRDDKTYYLDGEEVAVFYFRAGYSPSHYATEQLIKARLDMERSKAIKCPSVHYQLAGCKKVQQELSATGTLERFLQDKTVIKRIRATFAGQYSLDKGPEGDAAIDLALKSPETFVVKPQREGGGNNLYGKDLKKHLEKIRDSDERNGYILMERIFPWAQKNHLLKVGRDPKLGNVISELGIFGVYLGSGKDEIMNEEAGHLLRTKPQEDNEGGFLTGFATVDNPFLTY